MRATPAHANGRGLSGRHVESQYGLVASTGVAVEEAAFAKDGADRDAYRKLIRSRVVNLRQNAVLRKGLLSGAVTPDKFLGMSSDEMLTEEAKKKKARTAPAPTPSLAHPRPTRRRRTRRR